MFEHIKRGIDNVLNSAHFKTINEETNVLTKDGTKIPYQKLDTSTKTSDMVEYVQPVANLYIVGAN